MGFLDRFKKSSKSSETWTPPSGSSYSPPSSQSYDYSQYPDEKILNPGGYPVHSPPPGATYTNQQHYQQPQQQQYYPQPQQYQPHQQPAYNNRPNQPQYYNVQNPSHHPAHQQTFQHPQYPGQYTSPPPQQQQQQQQQQSLVVNLVSPLQPVYRQQNNRANIPLCDTGHQCERHTVKDDRKANFGRLFWRCRQCNRFVVWDDER